MKIFTLCLVFMFCILKISHGDILPPKIPWEGKSESLIVDPEHQWITPAEKTNFITTPNYAKTVEWLKALSRRSPYISIRTIGKSAQNRELIAVIAGFENDNFDSEKPSVLIQAGLHSGEIDGKDAGLMLLRDIAFGGKRDLLKSVNLIFIPVLNVDGHENASPYHRVNQRGPSNMGWRSTATNLNLNRDYAKAGSPVMKALLRLINELDPVLYLDIHVTDGMDYQYDITFGFNEVSAHSPAIAKWLQQHYRVDVNQALSNQGHIPGPVILSMDNRNPDNGFIDWVASPRYSNGYGDARHLPTVLIENHSLKPYKQRVLGTYILIEQSLKTAGEHIQSLKTAIKNDKDRRAKVGYGSHYPEKPSKEVPFLGVTYEKFKSEITGIEEVKWTGKKRDLKMPVFTPTRAGYFKRPKAYWIPAEWQTIIENMALHGIQFETIDDVKEITLAFYRLPDARIEKKAYEGRVRVRPGEITVENRSIKLQPGSVRIDTDQPLGTLAMCLLEPEARDSLLQWGFFLSIMQRTEYIEGYVIDPLAKEMLEKNPALKKAFAEKLKDEKFAKDPDARLQWFYQKSPYYDAMYRLYPIGFEPSDQEN